MKKPKHLIFTPLESFMNYKGSSGILLFVATIAAIVWANSPWADSYQEIWDYPVGFNFGSFELIKPLILWVNDGLMAIFFFLIGLEVKREILIGELNSMKKASLPIFAALGGVILPVVLFLVFNEDPITEKGWGIPMATDIAFSLAILTVLGSRVPIGLKVFLTALAIVDDIAAVLIIAVFYSENIDWMMLLYAMIPLVYLFILMFRKIYSKYLILIFGLVIWFLFLKSGIHPTIAGILVAFTVPLRQRFGIKDSMEKIDAKVLELGNAENLDVPIASKEQLHALDKIEAWTQRVRSPLQHLEHELHDWIAFVIIPIFAFANAGVDFASDASLDTGLMFNLAIALILGKSVGITFFTFLSVKLKLAKLPDRIKWIHIIGVGFLAGIGFTMSIFIANLAFTADKDLVDASKIGVILGSLIAGILGYVLLRLTLKDKK
ncbi:Na+/H+ antiporter NhaA [Crocinitomix catalasitica]|uniref:Na+/H+ antiporter NhaA n=1 Tax=Crocinitomix catalasitica TaxID=184607 RepID=UPI0004827688|nr:Na+/H+ antiporter NhaA [Crocinitomix catalasitica]